MPRYIERFYQEKSHTLPSENERSGSTRSAQRHNRRLVGRCLARSVSVTISMAKNTNSTSKAIGVSSHDQFFMLNSYKSRQEMKRPRNCDLSQMLDFSDKSCTQVLSRQHHHALCAVHKLKLVYVVVLPAYSSLKSARQAYNFKLKASLR